MKPLLVALITLAASAESIACSCLEDREDVGLLYALASVAFAGTIVEVEAYALDEFDEAPCIEGWTNSVIVIDVERVWKGDVPKRISVLSKLGDGGECGLEPRVGDYQAFFAQNLDPVDLLHVNTCTTPNVAIETIEAIVPFSVPPADGVDERAEVCRRSPPEPPPRTQLCLNTALFIRINRSLACGARFELEKAIPAGKGLATSVPTSQQCLCAKGSRDLAARGPLTHGLRAGRIGRPSPPGCREC